MSITTTITTIKTKIMKQDFYTAHIASNSYTICFDTAKGKTPESAAAAIKRKNSPDWKDCFIWVTGPNGEKEVMYDNHI